MAVVKPLSWRKPGEFPHDRGQALIIMNGQICLDVFTFDAQRMVFTTPCFYQKDIVQMKVKLNEVEAWMPLFDIGLPSWASKRRKLDVPRK